MRWSVGQALERNRDTERESSKATDGRAGQPEESGNSGGAWQEAGFLCTTPVANELDIYKTPNLKPKNSKEGKMLNSFVNYFSCSTFGS